MVVAFKYGQHTFAAGAGPATKDHAHVVSADQLLGLYRKSLGVGRAVGNDPFNGSSKQSALGVDLFQRKNFRVNH